MLTLQLLLSIFIVCNGDLIQISQQNKKVLLWNIIYVDMQK